VLRKKALQLEILYPIKLIFQSDREIKTLVDKQKWNEIVSSSSLSQTILKEILS
jgi:hypothetical protein